MKKLTPTEKAYRYVEKAKQVLIEKGEYDSELESYQNRNAVRSAGRLLWKAVETMVNAVFHVKNAQNPHPFIKDYENAVAQQYPKLTYVITNSYDTILGIMVDLGTQSKSLCDICFRRTDEYITILSKLIPQRPSNDASLPAQRVKLLTQHPGPSHFTSLTSTRNQLKAEKAILKS